MAIRRTIQFKRFYIGAMIRLQSVMDAINNSAEELVRERRAALQQVNALVNWLDRPFNEEVVL